MNIEYMKEETIKLMTPERIYLQWLLDKEKERLKKLIENNEKNDSYKRSLEKDIENIKGLNKKLLNR